MVVSRGFSQNIGRMLKASVREDREEFEEVAGTRHKNMFKISQFLSFRILFYSKFSCYLFAHLMSVKLGLKKSEIFKGFPMKRRAK